MKKTFKNFRQPLLGAAAGALTVLLIAGGATSAFAQASDAAEKCTPDVYKLCSEFMPDADRIVACLKSKRRQLSPECRGAMGSGGGKGHHRHLRKKEG